MSSKTGRSPTTTFDKDELPRDEVFFPTLSPELRLITCGGPFDLTSRSYEHNVVVFAVLDDDTRRPPSGNGPSIEIGRR